MKPVPFSDFFKEHLAEADIAFPGITARLLQGENGSAAFFNLPKGLEVPLHSHGAQWGIVVSGAIELTIGGVTKVYRQGDSYSIEDGEEHGAKILEDSLAIDVFAERDRYSPK